MAKKVKNERCPFRDECEKKCTYQNHENDCGYYIANETPDNHIDEFWYIRPIDNIFVDSLDDEKVELIYLPIEVLYPHPDNPRKDLGDIEELTESIKVKGILQNLTVVPGHHRTTAEWKAYCEQYNENPTEEIRHKINAKYYDDGYTVIIGHRRLAAATAAGLTEVPCVIDKNMTPEEQITTMLSENMQRTDLTVYEQAKGFQMALDFGSDIDTVAKKSGFSKTTVRRRIKLLELDEEKFKQSQTRNVSLFEYMKLDQLDSIERKNRVLDSIGTPNFKIELKKALDEEENEKVLDAYEEKVKEFAKKVDEKPDGFTYGGWYGTYNKDATVNVPDDADSTEYVYTRSKNYVGVFKKENVDEDAQAEKNRIAAEEAEKEKIRQAEIEQIKERVFECREEFVNGLTQTDIKKHLSEILAFWMFAQSNRRSSADEGDVLRMLGILTEENEDEEIEWNYADVLEIVTSSPEKYLWKMILLYVNDSPRKHYMTWSGEHTENQSLSDWYDFLVRLGYEMSDEEKALQDGTHEIYKQEDDSE